MAKTHSKLVKPLDPRVLALEVLRSERISPHFVRVTLGGPEAAGFTPMGVDQWLRLFLPREHQEAPRLPTATSMLWYPQVLAMPAAERPSIRNYTVREFRAARGDSGAELDLDFVVHGDAGIAGPWAQTAEPGARVGILDQGVGYTSPEGSEWQLFVADETGLPAIAGILASAPSDLLGRVIIEVPDAADAQALNAPPGVEVTWLVRDDHHATPGRLALDTARKIELGAGAAHAFVVGESGLATGLRRHLVTEKGLAKSAVTFCGYWKA